MKRNDEIRFFMDDPVLAPMRGSDQASGYDLRANGDYAISPGSYRVIPTGVHVEMPIDAIGTVRGRSGLATRGILAHVGTIDPDYRGEICMIIFNMSNTTFGINKYDRIGQIVFECDAKSKYNVIENYASISSMSKTERGVNGFGSTGIA